MDASTIILGFTGSIGSGCSYIAGSIPAIKSSYKYFNLSSIIDEELKLEGICSPTIAQKQNKGNELREKHTRSILPDKLIEIIRHDPDLNDSNFIIDGIKNGDEIQFLRQFPFFFLFSVQADTETRLIRCLENNIFANEIDFFEADERDEFEEFEFGQQVKKCNYLSDIIVFNNKQIPKADVNEKNDLITRICRDYVDLIEALKSGELKPTGKPSLNELCMTIVYSLSKMSSCIKRKVGAIITDTITTTTEPMADGHMVKELPFIISSGYNEVPLGSYKCIYHPEYEMCYRDFLQEKHAQLLKHCPACGTQIEYSVKCSECKKDFKKFTKFCPDCQKEIENKYKCSNCGEEIFNTFLPGGKNSPGKLLDMCRALHAEENALLKLANKGDNRNNNLTLFVTTQPCNLCANKIVISEIKKVVFDAPYSVKDSMDILNNGGVEIERFEGVKSSAFFKLYQ